MADPVRLIVVRNPFDRRERDERQIAVSSAPTIEALVGEYLPAGTPDGTELAVAVNGERVPAAEWGSRIIRPGDELVAMPVVHGSGGGILAAVASIALMVVAPYVAPAIYGALGGTFVAANAGLMIAGITMAVGLVGSAVIGSLLAPDKPQLPSRSLQSYDASPSYGWNPTTTQEPGGVVNRAYGRVKLYGNIIAGYIENTGDTGREQVAHALVDLGMGPYSRLYDFRINQQGIDNYRGVTLIERRGNLNQTVIGDFSDTRLTRPIGAKVVKESPVTRTTVGSDFDALDILLTFPQGLYYANDSGGLDARSVDLRVEVSEDGLTWRSVTSKVIARPQTVVQGRWSIGYYSTPYNFGSDFAQEVWVEMSSGGTNPASYVNGQWVGYGIARWIVQSVVVSVSDTVDFITVTGAQQQPIRKTIRVDNLTRGIAYQVRVTNLTEDQTSSRYGDDLYLSEINEVLYDDFTYPRTVLVGIRALATDQLSGGLQFDCMADAAIVRVWNGSTWVSEFSRNPAWICWDILTQPVLDDDLNVLRYDGLHPSRLILADFYAWAQWCDADVPGNSGMEPRCQWDGVFDTPTSCWEAALEVAASARATLLMRGTSVTVVWDRPRTLPAQVFSVGNTAVSSFRETFLPMQDRASAIEVDYINAEQDHQRDKLTVVNAAVTEASAQRVQFSNRGIRRPSQAWREAMVKLKRNELLRRTAELGVDIDAIACTVGDMIWVQNDVTRWGEGGRLVSGTTTSLVLDKAITLEAGKSYEAVVRLADDTIVTRTIATAAGTVSEVSVATAFPATPQPYDVWAIGEAGRAIKPFIVTDIRRDGEQRAALSLIEYNASLYGVDDGIPTVPTPDISSAGEVSSAQNLRITEEMYWAADGSIAVFIDVWFDISNAGSFGQARATLVRPNGSLTEQVVRGGHVRFDGLVSGQTYQVIIATSDLLGRPQAPSLWASASYTVIGEIPEPADVSGYSVNIVGDLAYHSWNASPDFDASHYTIRFSPATSGASWPSSVDLIERIGKATTSITTPAMVGSWLIKCYDRGGRESKSPAIAVSDVAALAGLNFVASVSEAPTFGGAHSGTEVIGSSLRLSSADTMSDWGALSAVPALSYGQNGIRGSGVYTFLNAADLGDVYTSRLTAGITVTGENLFNTMSSWATLSSVVTLSGTNGATYTARLELRSTNDDPAGSPTWTAWRSFLVGDYTGRAFQFRIQLTSSDPAVTPSVSALTVNIDMPDRVHGERGLICPAGGLTVTYSPAFKVAPAIGISAQGLASGDYYELSSETAAGFHIQFKNAGSGVERTFGYVAKGYGRIN